METTKGIYLEDQDQALRNLNLVKQRGTNPQDYVVRSILMDMFEYEEGWIPLKQAQQSAWDQVLTGDLTKGTLDSARRGMYNTTGLVLYKKKGTTSYLMLTELGREFVGWLLSDEGAKWGNHAAQRTRPRSPSPTVQRSESPKPLPTPGYTEEDFNQLKKDLNFPEVPEWGMVMDEPVPWPVYRHLSETYIQSGNMALAIVPQGSRVGVIEQLAEPNEKGKTAVTHWLPRWTEIKEDRSQLLARIRELEAQVKELRNG